MDRPATPVSSARLTLSKTASGVAPEAALEIGVDRQVAHGRHVAHVRQGIVA